jgi:organic radical activating enzyme
MFNKKIYQVEFFKNIKYDTNYFTLIVSANNYCNYSCEYCCENCNIKYENLKNINFDVLYIFITKILFFEVQNKLQKKLKISIYGGEPTLHPGLYDFCKKIFNFNKDIYIEIFTNFSKENDFYLKFLKNNVKLIITYHFNKKLDQNIFYKKITAINNIYLQNNIVLNIMYEHDYTEDNIILFNKLNNYLNNNKIKMIMPILIKYIRSTNFYNRQYTSKQLEEFKYIVNNIKKRFDYYYVIKYSNNKYEYINDEELELKNLNFNKWQCSAGKTSLYIDVNGYIYKCISYAYKNSIKQCTHFDSIFLCNDIKFVPTICKNNFCTDYDTNKINIFNRNTDIYV